MSRSAARSRATLSSSEALAARSTLAECTSFVKAVERALTSTFNSDHMSEAVAYMLDQQRLARRLERVPIGARKLLLQRKEVIFETLLAMDDDGNGKLEEAEFLAGVARLGLGDLDLEARRLLFDAFDLDGKGCIKGAELEIMIFGHRLGDEHRASLHRAAQLRRAKAIGDTSVSEGDISLAEKASFSHQAETAQERGRLASVVALVPLAAVASFARTVSSRPAQHKQEERLGDNPGEKRAEPAPPDAPVAVAE